MSEPKPVRLGDVVDLLTGFPFQSALYSDGPAAIRLVRGDNVVQGALRWEAAKRWPMNLVAGLDQYHLREGDVVLAMDRPWIEAGLKYAAIAGDDLPCLLVQRVARLRGVSALNQRYLKYVIGSAAFTDHVVAVQTGTAVPHISGSQILSFEFRLPPLDEQVAAVSILGALDDKIELNRRMNETLEAMARALFKSWFVDFDPVRAKAEGRAPAGMDAGTAALFPDGFEESELGEVPRGWRIASLDSVAQFLNGLALQKWPEVDGEPHHPVVKIAQLRAGHSDGADKANTSVPRQYIIDDGDLIFSWSGSLIVRVWGGGRGALNQHLFKVTSSKCPRWFVRGWLLQHLPEFQRIASGKATTMGHIQRHHLTSAKVLLPNAALLAAADGLMATTEDLQLRNQVQNRYVTELRDALLPKLMSGELHVREADQVVERVV
jgi:type I restriction enzyme S subunit